MEFDLPDDAAIEVEDLVTGSRFSWAGKVQHMLLDPHQRPIRSGAFSDQEHQADDNLLEPPRAELAVPAERAA